MIWTSRDGLTWQRATAAQLGLAGPGETVQSISYVTSRGNATVISGAVTARTGTYSAAWLSTNGGTAWTRLKIPADHGAGTTISGVASDGSGLIAVRPGRTRPVRRTASPTSRRTGGRGSTRRPSSRTRTRAGGRPAW